MKTFTDYMKQVEDLNPFRLAENASAGATCAANVAATPAAIGGLGIGFDPSADHGVYEKPKKKKTKDKVTVLRR